MLKTTDVLSTHSTIAGNIPTRKLHRVLETLGIAILYISSYWALDWFSSLYAPEKYDITPWNPSVAATVILLLLRGFKWLPLTFATPFFFQYIFEQQASLPSIAAVSGYETAIYGAAVWFAKKQKLDLTFTTLRDVLIFCGTFTLAAASMGIAYVLMFYFANIIPAEDAIGLMFEYWAGDALGILILTPLFVLHYREIGRKEWLDKTFSKTNITIALLITILVTAVFFLETLKIHTFYLFFIPIISIATIFGLRYVPFALLITQTGIIYYSWKLDIPTTTVTHFFPFFILALTWTGLILGALVHEKETSRVQIIKGNARIRALLDMAPDCMLIVDMTGHIVAANSNFARLCNTSTEWLLTQHIENIIPLFHSSYFGEAYIHSPDGNDITVELSTSQINVGEKYSIIVTAHDITSRKQAEAHNRLRRAATEQATRAYLTGSLAAVLAHELNQPLSAIMSYANVCKKTAATLIPAPPKLEEQIDKITVQAKRAGDIIRRLRDFFQNSSINIAPTDVSLLIQETLALLEDEITQTNTAIDIRILEPLTAAIDIVQIEQVLINIIRNSLEVLRGVPLDQRRIRISASRSMRGEIEVVVNDTGPGIPAEIADQLFNPFVTTRMSGMGLGLTISRSIIEAHNGRLWAELQSSSGAAMHFTIPVYQKDSK